MSTVSERLRQRGVVAEQEIGMDVVHAPDVTVGASGAMSDIAVRMTGLCKRFKRADGTYVNAIDDVSLDVGAGEFVVLLGPSGCGKTTLLRSIAGLDSPDDGEIEINGRSVFSAGRINLPAERRSVSMVFQSYALWPHMTAFDNVAYPLKCRGVSKRELRERVAGALALVGIPELSGQHPAQMSGGQQQRVALARALVVGGGVVLFDEPLSNVDARVREQLRFELLEMHMKLRFTAVYVTHDQAEAMELASRIAVMQSGRVAQLDTPRAIYSAPVSRYVATFLGAANEVTGTLVARDDAWSLSGDGEVVDSSSAASGMQDGDAAVAILRPEQCGLTRDRPDSVNRWAGTVQTVRYLGQHAEYFVELDDARLFRVRSAQADLAIEGEHVWISIAPSDVRIVRP
jgi:iron(III) transport system ATP-binding protein